MGDESDDVLQRFLAQPPEHGFSDDEPVLAVTTERPPGRWWQRLNHFLFEKEPSQYSSIAPRRADGTRTKVFFFNGSGKGR